RVHVAVLPLDDGVGLLRLVHPLGHVFGELALVGDVPGRLLGVHGLAAHAGGGVFLGVVALLAGHAAVLVGGALGALLRLVHAAAVDALVAQLRAVRAGALPAAPRCAAHVLRRLLLVARRGGGGGRVQVAADLPHVTGLVDVEVRREVVRLP